MRLTAIDAFILSEAASGAGCGLPGLQGCGFL